MARRLRHALVPLLLLTALVILVRTLDQHNVVRDVSRDARNSLDPRSVAVLAELDGPVEAVALLPDQPAIRRAVGDFYARYQRAKPDLSLRFLDPRKHGDAPELKRARMGEILLSHGERFERVDDLSESATTNALARLAQARDRYAVFLAGNGERRVLREANHDLSEFAKRLRDRGFELREYAPGRTADIPDNTAVLVLASPAIPYAPSELEQIARYLARGGNLLWLTEPDAKPGLVALADLLDVHALPGTVVDPVGATKFKDPTYAVALDVAPHALLEGFNQTVAFPYAAALEAAPKPPWRATVLAHTGAAAWNETGPFSGNVGHDAADEREGELMLGIALTRPRGDGGEQRVVVLGDGDFLSNTYGANLGNFEFGRRVVEWLAGGDALLELALPKAPDADLDLALWQRLTIFLFFGLTLPLAFAGNGLILWWRNRNA